MDELAGRDVRALDAAAHVREQFRHGDDVADVRNILEVDWLVCEKRRRHCGKGGIFCAADLDCPFELSSAVDLEAVHVISLDSLFDDAALSLLQERWRTWPPESASSTLSCARVCRRFQHDQRRWQIVSGLPHSACGGRRSYPCGFLENPRASPLQLLICQRHVHHPVLVHPSEAHHRSGGEQVQNHFLRSAGFHAR